MHTCGRHLVALAGVAAAASAMPAAAQSFGSFQWTDDSGRSDPSKPLTVHFRAPAAFTRDTPIWFVMHGASRNADDYRDYLAAAPASEGAFILAPEFTDESWPGSRSYNLGNVSDSESDPVARERELWSFSKIEALFDYVLESSEVNLRATSYSMYGHSAGGQFVHRFLMWEPEARVKLAVAANAGWYTVPSDADDLPEGAEPDYPYAWPYSVSDAPDYDASTPAVDPLPEANLESALAKRMVVLLGDQDLERTSNLRQTEEADAQGLNRFERGQFFYAAGQAEAERRGAPFNWGLEFVPGVAHSGSQMAVPAAEWLRAADAAPGDYNADGVVDQGDFAVWFDTFGEPVMPGLFADGSGNGVVDAADYTVWRNHVNPGDEAQELPEPGTGAYLAPAVLVARLRGGR